MEIKNTHLRLRVDKVLEILILPQNGFRDDVIICDARRGHKRRLWGLGQPRQLGGLLVVLETRKTAINDKSSRGCMQLISPLPSQYTYRQVSNIRRTLIGNKIIDHSDVVGASPVGAAPTTSSFSA